MIIGLPWDQTKWRVALFLEFTLGVYQEISMSPEGSIWADCSSKLLNISFYDFWGLGSQAGRHAANNNDGIIMGFNWLQHNRLEFASYGDQEVQFFAHSLLPTIKRPKTVGELSEQQKTVRELKNCRKTVGANTKLLENCRSSTKLSQNSSVEAASSSIIWKWSCCE